MATVNIDRSNKDSFYRYKMPRLQSKIEGKGNGIKTVIPNMEDIARCLSRPASYPTKFFGCELGAQTHMDDKNSRYIVNGAHDERTLSELLDKFIKKFVLCPSCSNPETVMLIDRKNEIWLDCKACGARSKVDMLHKLCVFILKNPPASAAGSGSAGKPAAMSKDQRREAKNKRNQGGSKRSSDSDEEAPAVDKPAETSRTGSDDAAKAVTGESAQTNGMGENGDEEGGSGLAFTPAITAATNGTSGSTDVSLITDVDEEFTVDEATVTQARKDLAQGLNTAVANLVMAKDDDAAEAAEDGRTKAYDDFAMYLAEAHTADEIKARMADANLKEDKAIAVLVQVSFTEKILDELPTKKDLLAKLVKSDKAIKGLLGGLERLAGVTYPALMPKFAKILKFMYDTDILDEDVIIAWNDKLSSKRYVDKDVGIKLRAQAKPLIDWLKTAEEESD